MHNNTTTISNSKSSFCSDTSKYEDKDKIVKLKNHVNILPPLNYPYSIKSVYINKMYPYGVKLLYQNFSKYTTI